MIVDDSLSVKKSLAEITSDAGYQALLARDGMEAVSVLLEHMPKVALVDLEMPNMNGLELTSHIRSDERLRDLPVIMITSRTQHKHRRQAQAAFAVLRYQRKRNVPLEYFGLFVEKPPHKIMVSDQQACDGPPQIMDYGDLRSWYWPISHMTGSQFLS